MERVDIETVAKALGIEVYERGQRAVVIEFLEDEIGADLSGLSGFDFTGAELDAVLQEEDIMRGRLLKVRLLHPAFEVTAPGNQYPVYSARQVEDMIFAHSEE